MKKYKEGYRDAKSNYFIPILSPLKFKLIELKGVLKWMIKGHIGTK